MSKTTKIVTSFQYPNCGSGKIWTMEKGCQNSSNIISCATPSMTSSSTSVTIIDSTNNKSKIQCINNNNLLSGPSATLITNCNSPGTPNTKTGTSNLPFGACNTNPYCPPNTPSIMYLSDDQNRCIPTKYGTPSKTNGDVIMANKCPTGYTFSNGKCI
jgi:hypothetical protein